MRMSWWMDDKWMMNTDQPVSPDLVEAGRRSDVTLEALHNRIRTFINARFAAEFHADGLKDGRIGLCLAGADAQSWTVHFDNFQIFLPAGKKPSLATAKPFHRSWNFSAGMLADIQSHGVE